MLRQRSGAADRTFQKLHRQIQVTIDNLGNCEIINISVADVLGVINLIANAGHVENAHVIRSRLSQVFRNAAARGLVKYDPAALTVDGMVPRISDEFAGLADPNEVGQLMRGIDLNRKKHFWGEFSLVVVCLLISTKYGIERHVLG